MLTGERLFALHGIDGVSLRQIGAAAGMANNTVVQYHFGSKDRLVEAILLNRVQLLANRRALLEEQASADDLRAVVEAQLLPLVELAEDPDCYYLLFLEQLHRYGTGENPFDRLPAPNRAAQERFVRRVIRLLPHLPPQLRRRRVHRASSLCLHTCADRQRARNFGAGVEPYALHVNQLFDGVEAFLLAPASKATVKALRASGTLSDSRRVLP